MKDSKSKKDYSKMSQEQLKEEARKIEVIDDDGSVVTIGELIERDKAKNNSTPQNTIPQKDSNENISNSNNDTIDDIFENTEQIKKYSDEYSKQNE